MPLYRRWRWSTSCMPNLYSSAQRDLDQAEVMRNTGDQMIAEDNYAVDSIRPKCIELQRMCDQYKSLLRRRREILNKSHDLQDRIDKANKWCNHGVDMLSEMQTAKCNTIEESRKALQDIEEFMATSSQLRLNNPKEFRQLFETMITPETRQVVQKVLRKMEDVHGMCERQRQSLQSTITSGRPTSSRPGPVRAVHPNTRTTNDTEQKRKAGQETAHKPHSVYEKSARLRTDGQQPGTKSRPYITYPTTGSVSNMSDPGSEKTRNSVSSMSTSTSVGSSNSDSETLLAKRRHVLNELIETEKTYVSQLSDILNGYYSKMEERSMQHLIPEELKGKRDILFGNLEQIYKFHNDTFLQELENCQDMPAKVGACFANRKEEFHLYSLYCQNKKRSEALRNQIGDQNPFFMECQRRLGHKLPLGAYLLKPVQRITKYQLLLKEMLRFSDDNQESEVQLREALNCMLEVVRYVNDSMHQVSIVGFPGNVADLGRILMQGSFTVSTEHTKGKIKDLRFKPMHRHVFLYEKVILLCKRKDEASNSDQGVYAFKNCLKLSQVGLTENVKGDRKKFELWLRGREEVYILLAPSLPSKEMWVKEIKRVLMNQFDQLKVHHRNVHGMSQEDLFNLTSSSNNSSRYVDNWKTHNVMIFNNNTPTVPQGLEMMSPESPPHGNQNQEAWSSDEYSDGEGEKVKQSSQQHYSSHPKSQPHHMQQFASLGNYTAEDNTELSLREGDIVRVLRSGSTGWWYVHHTGTGQEGWVPSTYLQPIRNGQSHTPISDYSEYSSSSQDLNSKSSLTSIYSSNTSPVDETTI
ncbi:hypothetical protein FSP39_013819 [Pinctada imbricata]|uniref:Guanine nucleotide exchange factor DBS n=1 Tax=Pinctada imbricata TaxID=66713 RepID=A0AA88Y440_PINIB|nr:hypothetical protein FSP39_013819 [Pinctada imbricata]